MRRTSALLVMLGLLFVYIRLPAAGLRDLLIDAVGYLIVFNGIRGLRYENGGFTLPMWLSIALVPVCAVEIFVNENLVLSIVRRVLELALYTGLFVSFIQVFKTRRLRFVLWLCAAGIAVCAATFSAGVACALLSYTKGFLYQAAMYYLPGIALLLTALVLVRYARLPAGGGRGNL